jgi:CubicO group peptidase (beta-lactamase class C family)
VSGAGAPSVAGEVEPGFGLVRDELERNFRERGEAGGSVCVYVAGKPVVDLWGGVARGEAAWQRDTIVPVFSVVKGATSLVVQLLADRGLLDVEAAVVKYWPEFGTNGKERATVRMILAHTIGLPWFDDYWDLVSFDGADGWLHAQEIAARLARQTPIWEPGTLVGYHSISFGWLVGEIVRRVTGGSVGDCFRTEVAKPLGLDLWVGELPESEFGRVAELRPPRGFGDYPGGAALLDADHPGRKALFLGPEGRPLWEVGNTPVFWTAEGAAAGGVSNARSVARMYGMLANGGELDGVRVVSADSVASHSAEQVRAIDSIWGFDARVALGYARPRPGIYFGPNDEAFGFTAFGGAIGFADPVAGVGFAYTMNQMRMEDHAEDPPVRALIDAVYACLDAADAQLPSTQASWAPRGE